MEKLKREDYEPDFSQKSRFSKEANYTSIVFGGDTPLMEVDLNEMQDILKEARAQVIRDTTVSGFISMKAITFDKSKGLDISPMEGYIDGYKVVVPKLNIPASKFSEEKTYSVVLSVWDAVVKSIDTIHKFGGEPLESIPNNLIDPRLNFETNRRLQRKWAIEVVESLDEAGADEKDKGIMRKGNKVLVPICDVKVTSKEGTLTDKRIPISLTGIFETDGSYIPEVKNPKCIVKHKGIFYIDGSEYRKLNVVKKLPSEDQIQEGQIYLVATGGDI